MRCGDALRGAASNRRHSFTSRVEALALLQTLNAELVSHDSATLTLDRWCEAHNLASPAHIVAERMQGVDRPPTAEQRRLLRVSASEPVRYRRVRRGPGLHPPRGTTAACRASNMPFLEYGLPLAVWPVAVLRALLMPLNILRLFQIRRYWQAFASHAPARSELDRSCAPWRWNGMRRAPFCSAKAIGATARTSSPREKWIFPR
jgi:hypothetical protein